jgi:hypothetical protein
MHRSVAIKHTTQGPVDLNRRLGYRLATAEGKQTVAQPFVNRQSKIFLVED